jgi:hypothetical protein
MRKRIFLLLPVIVCTFVIVTFAAHPVFADGNYLPGNNPFLRGTTVLEKGKIFSLNLDMQVGMTISNTKFNFNQSDSNTVKLENNTSKPGPSIGAVISINFLGFGFTSGFVYSNKGFQSSSGENFNYHYFNIPLLFYFDFDFGKVLIDGNFGPYFGLLLNQSDITSGLSNPYLLKNFDLGLTLDLQGTYMFAKHFGALLGGKFEYGGLNNLVSNQLVSSVRTQTYFIYTGMKFVL